MSPQPPTVVIVEDDSAIADLYETWLRSDYTVTAAATREDAESILDDSVDIAVLDRSLPNGSGDELVNTIRNRELTFPVAMVSGEIPDLDIIDLEIEAYHAKSIGKEELLDTIQTLLEETTYSAAKQEFYAIARKKALLETYRSDGRLEASEEFTKLTARHRELQTSFETQSGELTENLQAKIGQIQLDASD